MMFAMVLAVTSVGIKLLISPVEGGSHLDMKLVNGTKQTVVAYLPSLPTLFVEILAKKPEHAGLQTAVTPILGRSQFVTVKPGRSLTRRQMSKLLFGSLSKGKYLVRITYDDQGLNRLAELRGWSERSHVGKLNAGKFHVSISENRIIVKVAK